MIAISIAFFVGLSLGAAAGVMICSICRMAAE
jgi:hypothetical protein